MRNSIRIALILTQMLPLVAVFAASPSGATDLTMTFTDPETGKRMPDVLAQDHAVAKCDGIEGGPCLTLGAAIFHALLRPYADETETADPIKGEVKYLRGAIAYRIAGKKEAAFNPKELEQVKTVLGKLYSVSIMVQAYQALDPTLTK